VLDKQTTLQVLNAFDKNPGMRSGDGVPARCEAIQRIVYPMLLAACQKYRIVAPFWLTNRRIG
jgi:hypothetical protein